MSLINRDGLEVVDTPEELRALPIGTTMVDKDEVRLVKVSLTVYASDADLGGQSEGRTGRWTYFDEGELLGEYAEPAEPWGPFTIDLMGPRYA